MVIPYLHLLSSLYQEEAKERDQHILEKQSVYSFMKDSAHFPPLECGLDTNLDP